MSIQSTITAGATMTNPGIYLIFCLTIKMKHKHLKYKLKQMLLLFLQQQKSLKHCHPTTRLFSRKLFANSTFNGPVTFNFNSSRV